MGKKLYNILAVGVLMFFLVSAARGQEIKLRFTSNYPEAHMQGCGVAKVWLNEVEKRSNGRVKTTYTYGGALLGGEEMLEGIGAGVADVGAMAPVFVPGKLKIFGLFGGFTDLALAGLDCRGVVNVTWAMHDGFKEVQQEWDRYNVKLLVVSPTPAYQVGTKKPINRIEDFRNLKIRSHGKFQGKLMEAVGAVQVVMPLGDVYTSAQTGLVDGAVSLADSFKSVKLQELLKYMTHMGGVTVPFAPVVHIMNKDTWNKLPPDIQKIFDDLKWEMSIRAADMMATDEKKAMAELEAQGVKYITLTDEEMARWKKASPDWVPIVAQELNAGGLPGTEITKKVYELCQAYKAGKWRYR
jgi:TRAP-type C4-dicarboxylate transport system substrate-binding protein